MTVFNHNSRTHNVVRISMVGVCCNAVNIIMGFVYRTIFLFFLNSSYLGINGLFSNILQLLSFAELGITSAISFRLYEPISRNDVNKVGQLMGFIKNVYHVVAFVIFIVGMMIYPFINYFVKDTSEIPADVNLHFIYILFLFQTISSYMFVYKQTLVVSDQRQYMISLLNSLINLIRYVFQIIILAIYKDFTLTLIIGIVTSLFFNFIVSIWITCCYKDVFAVKEKLSKTERHKIFNDTKATLCHKIGYTVLNSTDNIVLSRFVGLVSVGIYSNYSLVITSLNSLLSQLLGNFTASLGNAHVELPKEKRYGVFRRLFFLNLWIASVCTICLYNLLNDFIVIWLGKDMLLDELVVIVLCFQFFFETSRYIQISYISACGLFVKDKIRPLIEAVINLLFSILLVLKLGIAGVFLGTIISHLATVFWREPYLLFRYEFKKSSLEYWKYYVEFFFITMMASVFFRWLFLDIVCVQMNIVTWFVKAVIIFLCANVINVILFCRNEDFSFYGRMLKGKVKGNHPITNR